MEERERERGGRERLLACLHWRVGGEGGGVLGMEGGGVMEEERGGRGWRGGGGARTFR